MSSERCDEQGGVIVAVFSRPGSVPFIVDSSKVEKFQKTDARTGYIEAKKRFQKHGGSKGIKIVTKTNWYE